MDARPAFGGRRRRVLEKLDETSEDAAYEAALIRSKLGYSIAEWDALHFDERETYRRGLIKLRVEELHALSGSLFPDLENSSEDSTLEEVSRADKLRGLGINVTMAEG